MLHVPHFPVLNCVGHGAEMASDRAESRQIATACLHNFAPHLELTDASGAITDVAVQVLNAVFEGLSAETDTVSETVSLLSYPAVFLGCFPLPWCV